MEVVLPTSTVNVEGDADTDGDSEGLTGQEVKRQRREVDAVLEPPVSGDDGKTS